MSEMNVKTVDMKWFEVIVKNGDNVVYETIVRSKEQRTAITNVLTNKYRGHCTGAEAYEVEVIRKIEKQEVSK
jgi:hypothetical protein